MNIDELMSQIPIGQLAAQLGLNEADTEALTAGFGRDLLPGLALLWELLLLTGWMQVRAGRKPP